MNNLLFEFGKASVETKMIGHGPGDNPVTFKNEPLA
jgi:hypothetical protein